MKIVTALIGLLLGACAAPPLAISESGAGTEAHDHQVENSIRKVIPHINLPDAAPVKLGLALSDQRRKTCQNLELTGAREGRWPAFSEASEPDKFRSEPASLTLETWDAKAVELNLGADGNHQDGCFINGYVSRSDEVVADLASGLAWARKASEPMESSEAPSWVAQANADRLGGHQTWRVPTVEELATLIDWAEYFRDTRLDPRFFSGTEDSFWTADILLADGASYAWAFDLRKGLSTFDFISDRPRRILLVRTMTMNEEGQ